MAPLPRAVAGVAGVAGAFSARAGIEQSALCDGNVALQERKANVLRVAAKTSAGDIEHLIYADIFYAEMEESSCYLYKQN